MYSATETTLTLVGCGMVLVFGFGRSFWMSVSWGLTYKGILSILLLIQAVITLLIAYIPQKQFFYMLWAVGAMFIFGGHFSLT